MAITFTPMTTIKLFWPSAIVILLGMIFGSISAYIWGSNPNIWQGEAIASTVLIDVDAKQSSILRNVLEHLQDRTPEQSRTIVCQMMLLNIGGLKNLQGQLHLLAENRDVLQNLLIQISNSEDIFQVNQCDNPKRYMFPNSAMDNK